MATWFIQGAKTGCLCGLVLAGIWGTREIIDAFRADPASRRDPHGGVRFALLLAALMAATAAATAIAGGCASLAGHALTSSMPVGFGRIASAMLLGSVVGAVVVGFLGACAVLLFGVILTPHDGQISLGAIFIGFFGAVLGAFLGALVGFQSSAP